MILVLGADEDHRGAAIWAASEPNILNVALTRAKRRFYVVGDRSLWGELGAFATSGERLTSIAAERFLEFAETLEWAGRTTQASGAGS